MQVEASSVIFLDDLGINLKPARELGMRTIKVEDPTVALQELEDLLGIDLGRG
jgi:putative hydrolase of the HAD superfamily